MEGLAELQAEAGLPEEWRPDLPIWRIDNLYSVVNEDGELVPFRLRPIQRAFIQSLWHRNLTLKSRQHGFTTLICVFGLDLCLWRRHTTFVIIAHSLADAEEIFRTKVKLPYESLDPLLKAQFPVVRWSGKQVEFANGSVIRVTTSGRSGTAQLLLVSEMGKIAKQYPQKAIEIVTGSFPAVHQTGYLFIESTAEGAAGKFYDLSMEAENHAKAGKPLTSKTLKFHFYPWFEKPGNRLSTERRVVDGVTMPSETDVTVIPQRLVEYFEKLEVELGITLDASQRAWYAEEEKVLGDEMKREHPATPKEAFEQAVKGAYFEQQMTDLRKSGRLREVPHDPAAVVDTWWDIGRNDLTAIWFTQTIGSWIHVIDYFEGSGEDVTYYCKLLHEWAQPVMEGGTGKGYVYGIHNGPHDIESVHFDAPASAKDQAEAMGIIFNVIPRVQRKIDSINALRGIYHRLVIDEARCAQLVKHMDNYRKQWDQNRGIWMDSPAKSPHNHCADAGQQLGMGVESAQNKRMQRREPVPRNAPRSGRRSI